ncbi:MAG: isoprenylcysteine carboxylmethyltransferase family protein [Actinobacteria bacterium]|nr:isoprenylcysteine carboxylmethyltransferase family protein [Actinomycetota bacterium]
MAIAALVVVVAMFVFVFVLRGVIQKRRTGDSGVRTSFAKASVGSLEWTAGWLLIVAAAASVGAPIVELAGLNPLTSSNWFRGAGLVVAILGVIMTFAAQMGMGDEWRVGVDASEETGLVTSGFFRLVRNPIFSAIMVAALGLVLTVPNVVSIVGFAMLIVSIQLQVRFVEEPHLIRLHGRTYTEYARSVGRFVPGLGRL